MKNYKQFIENMVDSVTTRQSSDQDQSNELNARKALSSSKASEIAMRTQKQAQFNKEKRDSQKEGAAMRAQQIAKRQNQQKQINQQKREGGINR